MHTFILLGLLAFASFANAQRMVFCHYMLWVPSTSDSVDGFVNDMNRARSYGIDAFAINTAQWNSADWPQPRMQKIRQAAEQTGFKFFMSADMTVEFPGNPNAVVDMVASLATSSAYLKVNGKAFLSTFVGEAVGWDWGNSVINPLNSRIGGVYFVPFFNGDPNSLASRGYVNGLFHWTAWPYSGDLQHPDAGLDYNFRSATSGHGKTFMAPVSPYFDKHYCGLPGDQKPNWVFGNYAGPGLWIEHWQQLIKVAPDFVEIVTWNDYPEGSYIGPITSPWGLNQPCNGVNMYDRTGYPHDAYGTLGKYFIDAYKNGGNYPTPSYDQVFAFYRTFSKNQQCNDPTGLGPLQNAGSMEDKVYIVTLFKQPATINVITGSQSQTFNAPAGLSQFSVNWQTGSQSVTVYRNNQQIQQHTWARQIDNQCVDGRVYDMNSYSENIAF